MKYLINIRHLKYCFTQLCTLFIHCSELEFAICHKSINRFQSAATVLINKLHSSMLFICTPNISPFSSPEACFPGVAINFQ